MTMERARSAGAAGGRWQLWLAAPGRGLVATVLAFMCAVAYPGSAAAQPKAKPAPAAKPGARATETVTDRKAKDGKDGKDAKEKNFDFNNLQLNGQLRTPQLLYFLERANEELERASLEKRSFIPHMVRSVEEEAL